MKQRWHYQGRGDVNGVDSYVWHRWMTLPASPTDNASTIERKVACAIPVTEFWPNGVAA